jgi:hypothetical protein
MDLLLLWLQLLHLWLLAGCRGPHLLWLLAGSLGPHLETYSAPVA